MSPDVWLVTAAQFELPQTADIPVKTVGIGLLPAMAGLSRHLERENPPRAIVLAGTAGLLSAKEPSSPFPLPPLLCNRFLYPRYCFEQIPQIIPQTRLTGGYKPLDLQVTPGVGVYSTFGITHDTSVLEFLNHDCLLENLEALGLAELCHQWGIAFYALLSVTNRVGPQGRQQWQQYHQAAGELLLSSLRQLFAEL